MKKILFSILLFLGFIISAQTVVSAVSGPAFTVYSTGSSISFVGNDNFSFSIIGTDRGRLLDFIDINADLLDAASKLTGLEVSMKVIEFPINSITTISSIVYLRTKGNYVSIYIQNSGSYVLLNFTRENLLAFRTVIQSAYDVNKKMLTTNQTLQALVLNAKIKFEQ